MRLHPRHVEHSDPSELGELRLMGMEHVKAGLVVLIGEEDVALSLALHDQIDGRQCRRQGCSWSK